MLKEKTRNSNIELLRIISIIFIILSHCTSHNGINTYELPIGPNRFFLNAFVLGNMGVILFILISGYFLIDSDRFELKKLVKIIFQVWFYSMGIYLIFCATGLTSFSLRGLITNFLPVASKRYWFATAYVSLYILHPFINKFLKSLSNKEYLLFLGTFLILFSIIPTFLSPTANFYGNELIQFILFYSIGGYLKKYKLNWLTMKYNVCVLILSIFALIFSIIIIDLLSVKYPGLGYYATYFYERHSIIAIIFSVSLFYCFVNIKPFYNKCINMVSSTTFGIYLIHDNNFIRDILWTKILHAERFVSSNYLIIFFALSVTAIFITCMIIEFIRQKFVEKNFFRFFGKIFDNVQTYIEKKLNMKKL